MAEPYRVEVQVRADALIKELEAANERLSEERIRQIVREELHALTMKPAIRAPGWQQFEVK